MGAAAGGAAGSAGAGGLPGEAAFGSDHAVTR